MAAGDQHLGRGRERLDGMGGQRGSHEPEAAQGVLRRLVGSSGRVGLYEGLSNQHEVVMVWATDIPSQVRLRQNRDTTRGLCDEGDVDERLVQWDRRSAEYVTGGDTHVMTPLPRTVYGPPDWEDASLDDW